MLIVTNKAFMLIVVMLIVIMLNVIMLSVAAPTKERYSAATCWPNRVNFFA
jgi:hypothetical protein